MYSMYISPNQCKYSEFKNDLNIAVYTQTLGKSFAHQLVLSFGMLPFPKGDCLIQVWLHLAYLCSSSSAYSWKKLLPPFFNPLHPNIGMHILLTIPYTIPKVLTRRICSTIKSFLSWWSFLLFSWPWCVI